MAEEDDAASMSSETDSDIEELDQAATQMQRVQRGKAARAEYQRDREAVVKVQSVARGRAVRKAQGNAGGGQARTKTGVTFVSNPLEGDIESGAGSREASASPPPQPDSRADLALMPKGKLLPYCGAVCLPCLGLPAIAELLKMGALLRSVQLYDSAHIDLVYIYSLSAVSPVESAARAGRRNEPDLALHSAKRANHLGFIGVVFGTMCWMVVYGVFIKPLLETPDPCEGCAHT